jgi:hypothetical protein
MLPSTIIFLEDKIGGRTVGNKQARVKCLNFETEKHFCIKTNYLACLKKILFNFESRN